MSILTTVNVVHAQREVKYEKIPPKSFNLAMPCVKPMKKDEDSVSTDPPPMFSFNVALKAAAVLWTKTLLVLVMVELARVWDDLVASAIALPPLSILPAILSTVSGTRINANEPARRARRGNTSSRSMADGSMELFDMIAVLARVRCSQLRSRRLIQQACASGDGDDVKPHDACSFSLTKHAGHLSFHPTGCPMTVTYIVCAAEEARVGVHATSCGLAADHDISTRAEVRIRAKH